MWICVCVGYKTFPSAFPATSKPIADTGKNNSASQLIVRVENIWEVTPTMLKYSPGPPRSPIICGRLHDETPKKTILYNNHQLAHLINPKKHQIEKEGPICQGVPGVRTPTPKSIFHTFLTGESRKSAVDERLGFIQDLLLMQYRSERKQSW